MALSYSTDYTITAEALAISALQLVRKVENNPPFIDKNTLDTALSNLNLILKHWQNDGLHLWTIEEGRVYLKENQFIYKLSDFVSNAVADVDLFKVVYNTKVLATATNVVDIPLTGANWPWSSPTTNTTYVEVLADDGDLEVATASVYADNTTYTRLTIGSTFTSDVVANCTAKVVQRTLEDVDHVLNNEIFYREDTSHTPITLVGREEWMNTTNWYDKGTPNTVYFRKTKQEAELWVNPVPSSTAADNIIGFSYARLVHDLDDRANNVEIPITFFKAIRDELVHILASVYDLPLEERAYFLQIAQLSKQEALSNDKERPPLHMNFSTRGG